MQFDGDLLCAPVFHSIGHGFLRDAQQVHLYRPGEAHRAAFDLDFHLRLPAWDKRLDHMG